MKPAMVRSIDSQGRFIIPTEIRKTMDLTEGDILEIRTFSNGIFLSKYTAQIHDPDMKKYLEILYSVIRCSTAICSKDQVLAAKGTGLREGTRVCAQLAELIQSQQPIVCKEPVYTTESRNYPVDTLIPMTVPGYLSQPMALLLFSQDHKQVSEEERLCARIIAALLSSDSRNTY